MNKSLLIVFALIVSTLQLEFEQIFDLNDVENKACQNGCKEDKVRWSTYKDTFTNLNQCSVCTTLFELCVKYRTCQSNCVPEMPVLPYKVARDFAYRVRPPMNPCLELVSACNYESMDAYESLRTDNPFLFI
ncbi:unnamed protein product [Caenorhabditis sp. 36 PRJEB53466]|nr:unnamed protein product [Caenorhabditis sp. 36 PRJEB53466]